MALGNCVYAAQVLHEEFKLGSMRFRKQLLNLALMPVITQMH